jgi:hypothetical protein
MVLVFVVMFIVTAIVSILWANAIDKMPKDYKGEEFLNWDRQNDDWDDGKNHTEGQL